MELGFKDIKICLLGKIHFGNWKEQFVNKYIQRDHVLVKKMLVDEIHNILKYMRSSSDCYDQKGRNVMF